MIFFSEVSRETLAAEGQGHPPKDVRENAFAWDARVEQEK